jgi:hypothetical protein
MSHHKGETPMNNVIMIRPRRASESARRTQVQLPINMFMQGPFFRWVYSLQNQETGAAHRLVFAHARGRLNTIKVEIPEIANMYNPVLVLKRSEDGTVTYRAYDAHIDSVGQWVLNALQSGLKTNTTRISRRPVEKATWFQYVA